MNKIKPEIKDDIAETLFIPLLSRAHESHRKDAILKDPMACELVEKIDYDFAKFGKITMSTTGTTIRLRHFDRLVQRFIDRKVTEDPVVVSIGCGLDSRFQRVSNHNQATFYELDLPEVINLREKLFPASAKDLTIKGSMLETDWMDMLRQKHPHGRFLFLAEGVMMYFNEEQVKSVIQNLAQRFPGCEIYFDFVSKWAARNSDKHESVKRTKARFHFGLNDPHTIEQWFPKLKLIERFYFISEEKKRWGLPGLIMWLIPALHKSFGIVGYKVGEISKYQNKYCIHFFASLTQFFQEFHFRNLNTAYSLNTFNNHRTDISFCQFRFSCFYIVQRQISHMPIVIDWGYNFRIVGY